MINEFAAEDIGTHCDLGAAPVRDVLLRAVDLCRADPRFALPAVVRDLDVRGLDVVVFGTTSYAQIFMRAVADLQINVVAAVDDFRGGLECVGKPIVASRDVAALKRRHPGLLAVHAGRNDRAIRHFERVANQAGVPVITFEQAVRLFGIGERVDYRVADWGPEICSRTGEFLALEKRTVDEYSRQTLYAVLLFHLTGSMEWVHAVSRPYPTLYFRSGLFTVGTDERLVDCGASIGESTGGLLALTGNRIGRAWMLEPDKFNHAKLEALMAEVPADVRSRLSLHKVAVGSAPGRMRFNHVGGHTGSITADSHAYGEIEEVAVETIDAIIDAPPTMIKMDIEGAELDALRGATGAIRAGRPKMAISAYHRATDLIDLPRFVDSLDAGYRIGIRHHTEERYDTCLYFMPG